jgi:hypothetical protein
MARIRIILEDEEGRKLAGTRPRIYELGKVLDSLHEIEGALERFRREVLPELTAELLSEAQAAAIKDPKKEMD